MGFFGKLPSRGDFLRSGLPRGFTDPWDEWLQGVIAGSREILGERWLPAWMEAPIWFFALPAGQCGALAACGVWMPSVDAAGRHFPLTLACVGAPADAAWLAGAEAAGLAALAEDLAPEALARLLAEVPPGAGAGGCDTAGLWWTEGSPFVPATRLRLDALPDAATFAAMLHADADADAEEQPVVPPDAEESGAAGVGAAGVGAGGVQA